MIRLLFKGALLLAITVTTLLAFLAYGSDESGRKRDDYRKEVLSRRGQPRIAFVGGSNLYYGLDSERIELQTGRPTMNFGSNAHLGMSYLIGTVARSLTNDDVLVAAFEYAMYFRDPTYLLYDDPNPFDGVNGAGPDLLHAFLEYPWNAIKVFNGRQMVKVARAVPLAAQQKAMRLIEEFIENLTGESSNDESDAEVSLGDEESKWGDFCGHRSHPGTFVGKIRKSVLVRPINPEALAFLRQVSNYLSARGVRFLLLPPPMPASVYLRERRNVAAIAEALREAQPAEAALFLPENYVFADSCFFDTDTHLNWSCRRVRTDRVLQDLAAAGVATASVDRTPTDEFNCGRTEPR